jgi:hypothetical protein
MYLSFEQRQKIRQTLLSSLDKNQETWFCHMRYLNYMVSSYGRIKNLYTGKILKPTINDSGYQGVKLYHNNGKSTRLVHRLVAETVIPLFYQNRETDYEVNHINFNKTDNNIFNLEWVTRQENLKHLYLNKCRVKKLEPGLKLKIQDLKDIYELYNLGFSKKEIAKSYNITLGYTYQLIGKFKKGEQNVQH